MRKVSFVVLFGLLAALFAGTAEARPTNKADKVATSEKPVRSLDGRRSLEAAIVTQPGPGRAEAATTNETTASAAAASTQVDVHITAVLEGAWDADTAQMSTHLGDDELDGVLLDLPQVYADALSWWDVDDFPSLSLAEYEGASPGVVDWVLVEFAQTSGTNLSFVQPAILRADGSITAPDDATGFSMELPTGPDYRITVHHRNHLSLASTLTHDAATGVIIDDLSTNGTFAGSATVSDSTGASVTALAAGNYHWDRVIQITDWEVWVANPAVLFEAAYHPANGNLDDVVNNIDYEYWLPNKAMVASQFVTGVIVSDAYYG